MYIIDTDAHLYHKHHCVICKADDKAETVLNRLTVYHSQTAPLVDFYQEKGLLRKIDGAQGMDVIFASILETLGVKE